MHLSIDNKSGRPIYDQIYTQLKDMIMNGTLPEGTGLPSIRVLAKDLRISVITTKHAYEDLKQVDQMIITPDRTGLPEEAYCNLNIAFGAVGMLRIGSKVYIPCYLESYLPEDMDDLYVDQVYVIEVIDLKSREVHSIEVCDMDYHMPQMQLYDLGNGTILINESPWLDYYGTDPFMGNVFLMDTETEGINKMDIPAGQYAMVKDAQLYLLYEDCVDVYDVGTMTKTESHPLSKDERMDWCLIFAGE